MDNENQIKNLCHNIRYLRESHNLSKKQIAKILGIGIKSLTLIESEIMPLSVNCSILYNIKIHFKIPIPQLFEEDLSKQKGQPM